MKKLLLTLLGATLLCGLSPHPLSAQTPEVKTATFALTPEAFQQGKITAGLRINGAMPTATDPTDFTINQKDTPKKLFTAPVGPKCYGWGYIAIQSATDPNLEAQISFDYANSPVIKTESVPYRGTSCLTSGYIELYKKNNDPSTAFSISLGEGKLIKSVTLTFPTGGFYYSSQTSLPEKYLAPVKGLDDYEDSNEYTVTDKTTSNNYFTSATYTTDAPYGSASPLCLQTRLSPAYYNLQISQITVTYIEKTDDMATESVTRSYSYKYGDPIYYMDENNTEWNRAGAATVKLDGKTVKVKIGKTITEFTAPASPKTGQHTVIINGIENWVGTTVGCKFRTYLDTEAENGMAYRVAYGNYVKFPNGYARSYRIKNNLTAPSTGVLPTATTAEELVTIINMGGLSVDDAVTVKDAPQYDYMLYGNATPDQKNGLDAAVIFDNITLSYTSSTPAGAAPLMVPDVKMPSAAALNTTTGIYTLFGSGKATLSSFAGETYTDITYRYALTDTPLDETTFTTQNSTAGNEVEIDGSKRYLAVRAYAVTDGKEIASAVRNFEFVKSDIISIDRAADLNASLKDKTVRLTFPLNILADGTMGSDKLKYMIYARDPENNPVVMVSRLASTSDTPVPGAAFKITTTATPDGAIFVPAGGVIATVATDEAGNVTLVLKDASKNIDHFDECYTGSALKYSATDIAATGINRHYATNINTHCRAEKLDASHYGRMVYIRGVSYDPTNKTFSDEAGNTIPVVATYTDAEKYLQNSASAYKRFNALPTSSDTKNTIHGIVEYDPTAGEGAKYYIMLRNHKPTQNFTGITFPTTGQTIGDLIENDDKTAGQIEVNHASTTTGINIKPQGPTSGYYWYWINGVLQANPVSASTNIQAKTAQFKDGMATFQIEYSDIVNTTNSLSNDRSDVYTLTLIDKAVQGKKHTTLSEMKAALGEKPEDGVYSTVSTPYSMPFNISNRSGDWNIATIMVAYIRGDYMLVRDIARNGEESNFSLADDQQPNADFYLLKSHATGWLTYKTTYKSSSGTNTTRSIQEGDGITVLTGSTLIDNNNLVIVPAGVAADLYGTTADTDLKTSTPLFKQYAGTLDISATISDPASTAIGTEKIGKILLINGVKLKAPASENDPYMAAMKSDVKLSWKRLRAADKEAQQTEISASGVDNKFDITVYVMSDGNDGIEFEIIDIENPSYIVKVCEHEHHDTYFGNASLDRFADNDPITIRGAKVTKKFAEGSTTDYTLWTTIGQEEIGLDWGTNVTLIKPINTDMGTNTVTSSAFEISGLVKTTDGKKSIGLTAVTKTESYTENDPNNLKIYLNGQQLRTNSSEAVFTDYGMITFDAPEWTKLSYKIVSTDGGDADPDAKWQTIGIGDTLTIDRTHVIQIQGCAPDHKSQSRFNINFKKTAPEAADIEEALTNVVTGTNVNYIHLRNAVRVSSAFTAWPHGNVITVTDATGRHLIVHTDNYSELPETGSLLKDFAVQRITSYHSLYIGSLNDTYHYQMQRKPAEVAAQPEEGEQLPDIAPILADRLQAENVERLVRLTDVIITESADGSLTFHTEADKDNEISLNNAFDCEIADNGPESGYILTGLLLPKPGTNLPRSKESTAAEADDAEATLTLADMNFTPIRIEKRRPTVTPTFELTGHESFDDNVAVTIEDLTLTMECADYYSTIEYSLDGGNTWTVYDGKPLTIAESHQVRIKATAKGFDPSETVAFEIKREYYSEEAVITPDQRGGYTTVTFATPEGENDEFTVYYTLDGSEPDMNADMFTPGMKPLELTEAATVKALMIEQGKRPAKTVASQALTVRANDLDITAEKGEGFTTVAIAPKDAKHVDPKAEIRYTTDGTTPDASSQLYKGEFEVEAADNGMTIKAICIEPGKTAGNVASATVAVEGLRPSCDVTISYTEADGVYTITLTAPAGKIFYALNDATEFKLYDPAKPITYVSDTDGTCRIRAYALEEGKKEGKIAEHSFAVTGIDGVGADQEAGSVRVEGNSIIVPEGAQTFDIAGRRVNPQGLPRGIYIVRLASGKAVKAVVK